MTERDIFVLLVQHLYESDVSYRDTDTGEELAFRAHDMVVISRFRYSIDWIMEICLRDEMFSITRKRQHGGTYLYVWKTRPSDDVLVEIILKLS